MREFEIRIRKPSGDGACPVEVRVPAEDRRADGIFSSPYTDEEMARAQVWMEAGALETSEVKTFGARLFRALFRDTIKQVYTECRVASPEPLRFRLLLDAPAQARLPWELLYDPEQEIFLALGSTVVRGFATGEATRPLTVNPPLRVLVVTAAPRGVLKLEDEREIAGIEQALASLTRLRRVDVVPLAHITLSGLQAALRAAANAGRPFHILHFIGHGAYDRDAQRPVLLFEKDGERPGGGLDPVDAEALLDVVRPYDLKLIFLNACRTLAWSADDTASSFAPPLLESGIPAVIGMQLAVEDRAAAAFSREFYKALAANQPVDVALADARRIMRSDPRRKADVAIPACYLRTATGQILDVERIPLTPRSLRPWLRHNMTPARAFGVLVALIGLASGIVGLVDYGQRHWASPPPMAGDINVAVAEFGEIDAQGRTIRSPSAAGLATSVWKEMDDELNALTGSVGDAFIVEVRPPDQVRRIAGATAGERAERAEKLADDINADVIVYGNLKSGAETDDFVPEFWISDRQLSDAEELAGQYGYGSALQDLGDVDGNPVAREQLRKRLVARTRAFSQFVIGLGYYTLGKNATTPEAAKGDFGAARASFQNALEAEGWDERDGKEVLYFFLGNAVLTLGDLNEAAGYYQRALDLNPEYARAQLGAAQVVYLGAKGQCLQGAIDEAGLRRAIADTQAALTARDQPAVSDVGVKAAYQIGRAELCLSLAGSESGWDHAEAQLLRVIQECRGTKSAAAILTSCESGNQRVRELAALASADLGLLYWQRPAADAAALAASERRALTLYEQAIALTRHDDRKARYHSMRGQLYVRLGECAPADAEFAQAVTLDAAQRATYEDQGRRYHQVCTGGAS